jgi:APA family basic amino acid/polyamine antiporter
VPVSPGGGSVSAGALAAAVMAAFFAFGGWWDVGRMSEEVADPRRTMPRALLGGLALVTVIYALVSVSFVLVAGGAAGSSDDAFVSAVGAALFGASAGRLLAAMVAITVTGSLAAVFLAAPRMYLAMARDGLIPGGDRWFEPDRGTSRRGTLLQTLLAGLLVAFGTFDQILGYFVPMAVLFLGLSAAAVLVLPRLPADAEAFRAPLHPLPIVLFLALVLAVLVLVVVGQPMQALGGALVVALGVAASYVRPPGHSPSVARRSSDA